MVGQNYSDADETKVLSTFLVRMDGQGAYLVRIHPVAIGDGIITLPNRKVVIGRDQGCELCLADNDVSRHHASLGFVDGEYAISDLASTNGTFVNNEKVTRQALRSGDLIRMGKTILKFLRGNDIEKQYHETVYTMMIKDGLTGIANKRFLVEALQRELIRSQRHKRPLSIAVLDIDHFKKVNDTYGHLAGDVVLRELALRIGATIRKDEVFARYGGEEFVVLLPESNLQDTRAFAERIRELVANEPINSGCGMLNMTISIGIAHTSGENEISVEEFFQQADRKLYEAKGLGRNRVVG